MTTPSNNKLGLALAGGGFRASLFHVGVLRRLAELDVLRHVQVLSTVSGGSIVGAIYMLRLKKWLEDPHKGPRLTRENYIKLVEEVDDILSRGVAKNLRTRLFVNPLTTLRVMLTSESMGRAMSRLYERHMLREAMQRQPGRVWDPEEDEPVDLHLDHLRIYPHGVTLDAGIDAYNANEIATPGGSAITSVVINATSLNSGGRFFFTGVELGDWYLGHFRRDEAKGLPLIHERLRRDPDVLEKEVHEAHAQAMTDPKKARHARQLSLALWWRRRRDDLDAPNPEGWERLFSHAVGAALPGELPECALGAMRQVKVAAWYLRYGYADEQKPKITGGLTQQEHWRRICGLLGEIDRGLAAAIRDSGLKYHEEAAQLLLEYIYELYMIRTAALASDHFEEDWKKLTIADAVGASACFPPVFAPFVLLGLYDDAHVTRLGLTDGGVYDNAGIIALLDEGCTAVIASDTGGVFDELKNAPSDHIRMSFRLPSILMRVVGGFQRLTLRERKRVSRDLYDVGCKVPETPDCSAAHEMLADARSTRELNDLAYFQIATPAPPLPADWAPPLELTIDPRKVALLRTDLDCFGEIEIAALVNTGYNTADRFVRGFMQCYAQDFWKTAQPRAPKPIVKKEVAEPVLVAGSSRFLRALHLAAPLSIAVVSALAALALIAAASGVTFADIWQYPRNAIYALPAFTRWIPERLVPYGVRALGSSAGMAALGLVLLIVVFRSATRVQTRGGWSPPKWFRTVMKHVTSGIWNVTWFAWALPLLVAFASAVIAAASWICFFVPWRAKAKIFERDREKIAPEAPAPELEPSVPR